MFVFLHRIQARSLRYDTTHTDHDDVRPHKSRRGKHLSPIPIPWLKLVSLTRAPNPSHPGYDCSLVYTHPPPPHPPKEPNCPTVGDGLACWYASFSVFSCFLVFSPIFLRGRHCSAVLHQCLSPTLLLPASPTVQTLREGDTGSEEREIHHLHSRTSPPPPFFIPRVSFSP